MLNRGRARADRTMVITARPTRIKVEVSSTDLASRRAMRCSPAGPRSTIVRKIASPQAGVPLGRRTTTRIALSHFRILGATKIHQRLGRRITPMASTSDSTTLELVIKIPAMDPGQTTRPKISRIRPRCRRPRTSGPRIRHAQTHDRQQQRLQ